MMFRTHLAFGLFFGLLFIPFINFKIVFILTVLFSSLLPDIDTANSYLGRRKIFRPLQWAIKHRNFIHSFTFAIIISFLFTLYIPILAFPFFLGFGSHLLADSLTPEGIRPFWPFKEEFHWKIRTGGKTEKVILYFLIAVNLFILLKFFI